MAAGRPAGYNDGLGAELIALMRRGFSLTASAAKLGFHRQTFYDWEKKHPAFSDDIKKARGLRLYKLEKDLLEARDGPKVTSRIFALKNADAQEWRDVVRQEHTGAVRVEESPGEIINRELTRLTVVGGTEAGTK